jgi:TetR/AcrR family transcriptional regulator, regulator of cefoperazone and chloramphenicol sensitivity
VSDALLDAAIAQFGEHGLDGPSTRAIAAAAGTAMSTITYRYGGKEGLYLAAADHIAAVIAARLDGAFTASQPDPVDQVAMIVRRLAALMLSDESGAWARFIVREQMHPTEAFARLWNGAMKRLHDHLVACVMAATGEQNPRAARLTALTLMGQALVFRAARAAVLRSLDQDALGPADLAEIQNRLEANVRAILTSGTRV